MPNTQNNPSGSGPVMQIAVVWCALCAIFIAVNFQRLMHGQFPDPDDALRLVQVRDLIAGQAWFDVTQYRIDPPAGTVMHWSRLVDVPLALLIAVLTPLFGVPAAETITLIVIPLLTLGVVLAIIGLLSWRLFGGEVLTFACLSIGLLTPLIFQLQPMRIDHHGWQIVAVAAALWGMAHARAARGGAIAGAAMAWGLTISVEILPMVAAFGAVLALRWWRDHAARWWLVSYMAALAVGLVAAFLATRGPGNFEQYCDAVSPAHLAFFAITAAGTAAIAVLPAMPRPAWVAAFALVGASGIALFGMLSPTCLATPFAALDPVVRDYWYVHIAEGRPIWEQAPLTAVPVVLQLFAALLAVIMLFRLASGEKRMWWCEYGLLLLASILAALLVWRSAAFACLIAAIPLGWLAVQLLGRFRHAERVPARLGFAAVLVVVLMPAAPVTALKLLMPAEPPAHSAPLEPASKNVADARCQVREQAAKLDRLPIGTVLAPLDMGPSILLQSRQYVAATSHHRAQMAMRDVILTFTGPIEQARSIAKARGAAYIVICTDLNELNLYAAANTDGLAARLIAGDAPDWLERVPLGGPAEFGVWKVR